MVCRLVYKYTSEATTIPSFPYGINCFAPLDHHHHFKKLLLEGIVSPLKSKKHAPEHVSARFIHRFAPFENTARIREYGHPQRMATNSTRYPSARYGCEDLHKSIRQRQSWIVDQMFLPTVNIEKLRFMFQEPTIECP
ncbi:hypothetical protein CRM22_004522 [Opisthorchis felineus]|uniref:Uncharacterized protein n=1 Tax=Opisthorchis felineus TaxID=147828 RepID=A0A4S2LWM9_OPIFE|nr:hypothetical protein CRM22_004522 [Opisthorchis felineus]